MVPIVSKVLIKLHSYFRGLETLQVNRRASLFFHCVNLGEMVMCLEDLINYFAQPGEEMGN
jgi:ryanodine receptor 2